MQKYELLLILPGTLDEKEVEARSQEILTVVKEHGSDVTVENMGKNRLAYPIKQIRYGYYFAVTFKAEAKDVKTLEQKFSLMRDVLRAIISYYNTDITAQQKLAYTNAQASAMAVVADKEVAPSFEPAPRKAAVAEEKVEEVAPVEKAEKQLDIEQITKKLDDLMSGDVIPGV